MEASQSEQKDRRHGALGDLRVLPDEILCSILEHLTPRDIARLSCVSSVMYILCNEEPLWMHLCLSGDGGLLAYKGSWRETTIQHQHLAKEFSEPCTKPLRFEGFNSLFLYRRWYRCFTSLDSFSTDRGDLERKEDLSFADFHFLYDGQKPLLLTGLAKNWPARSTWTIDQLLQNYGDTAFRISQRSVSKITMKFKDYVSYMGVQHDEDPLYVFDDKFGEVAPNLLKDYSVPQLFQEDLFDVLDRDQRPPFRWLIIGPERSGASWHVDPALTSAWNTLICGRKRWALYPPGRVPLGVTVHVSEEDGDINVETPSSLQWWLDIYPLLMEQDKPLECTQLPGETIFVPSGWWHCVLNLETSVAVTQNFVNTSNFEFVCLDMAPGCRHRGVCRAGLLAIDGDISENAKNMASCDINHFNFLDMSRERKRFKVSNTGERSYVDNNDKKATNIVLPGPVFLQNQEFSYNIAFLSTFLEEDRDHYTSIWSPSNCIGPKESRKWLQKLWVVKPDIRELVWKGACMVLNADKWSERLMEICTSHNLPSPTIEEKLPIGTGSNPVYLVADHAIKIYVEGGLESSLNSLGTELEFYNLLHELRSPIRDHIPDILASGILFFESGSYRTVPWDGKGVPDVINECNLIRENYSVDGFSFGVWSKKIFEFRKGGRLVPVDRLADSRACSRIWPYIIMRRCKGDIFAHLRDRLTRHDVLELASFLGDQVRNLHLLPLPSLPNLCKAHALLPEIKQKTGFTRTFSSDLGNVSEVPSTNDFMEPVGVSSSILVEWELFTETMNSRKKDVSNCLAKWGDPIPSLLIEKVEEYLPHDTSVLLDITMDKDGVVKACKPPTWIHRDIMDDNVHMEPWFPMRCLDENAPSASVVNGYNGDMKQRKWHASYILDFSDLSIGDPIFDLIPIYLDVFRGDSGLLKHFLDSYRLPITMRTSYSGTCLNGSEESRNKFKRISYRAMCCCILHEENVLGAIFSLWKELRMAKSWEEVEETVWGMLNDYQGSC